MADTLLDIVDENDRVIGQALRSEVHAKGLCHREVGVWFITPDRKIIFQRRGQDKEMSPNLLDATAGGHVELGKSYRQSALDEVMEETGLLLDEQDIKLIVKEHSDHIDQVNGQRNNIFREIYGYFYKGKIEDLKIEIGKGAGFKAFPVELIYQPTPEFLAETIHSHVHPDRHFIFQALEKLI